MRIPQNGALATNPEVMRKIARISFSARTVYFEGSNVPVPIRDVVFDFSDFSLAEKANFFNCFD